MTYEGLRLKLLEIKRGMLGKRRNKLIKDESFTIISNNCWGGMVYESFNIKKRSPTVGLFFIAYDYIELLKDLKGYIYGQLSFIRPEESRWKNMPQVYADKRFGSYPIGLLSNGKNSIEIFFLHYHSEKEAKEKWERRKERINWDKMLVKFNDQNGCTQELVDEFGRLEYKNKIFFTCKNWNDSKEYMIKIRQWPHHDTIQASYEPIFGRRYIVLSDILNSL